MRTERLQLTTLGAILGLATLAACDSGPTEAPAYDPAGVATDFAMLQPDGLAADDVEHEAECPNGGKFIYRFNLSTEEDGDVTIRHVQLDRRYEQCSMSAPSGQFAIDGHRSWTGEQHLSTVDGNLRVLLQKGRQVGTMRLTRNGTEIRNCEYDVEEVLEPVAGRFSIKGIVCGIALDHERKMPIWAVSS